MLLAREEGNEKQPNVKMWGLGCGGGAVLKGMPLLKCRVTPRRALPFPARKGRGRGVGGRGPGSRPAGCGSEFQPRSEHTSPARFPARGDGAFLAGGASVPGERALLSFLTAGLRDRRMAPRRAAWAVRACAPACCAADPPPGGRVRRHRSRQVPAGGPGTGLGPSPTGSMGFLSLCALGPGE